MNRTKLTVIAVVLFLLAGCAAPAPSPTATPVPTATPEPTATPAPTPTPEPRLATSPEDIVGIWYKNMYWQFNQDGTAQILYVSAEFEASAVAKMMEDRPHGEGEFRFEGTQFFWRTTKVTSALTRCENPEAIYEITVLGNGKLKFNAIEEDCRMRRQALEGTHEPVR